MSHQYIRASVILLFTLNFGSVFADEERRFDGDQAMSLMYGGTVVRNEALRSYFQGQDNGYVAIAYENSYVEQGQRKRVVVFRITPKPADEYVCHACAPVIGVGLFTLSGHEWAAESKAQLIGFGNALGEKFSLVEIGPDKHGILDVIADSHQGYEDKSIRLIVPYQGVYRAALEVGFIEKPGPAACENVTLPEQSAGISFLQTKDNFFDVVAKLEFNEGSCESFLARSQAKRYRFRDGVYGELSQ